MRPFDEKARCPKCGHAEIGASWIAPEKCRYDHSCGHPEEHIHRHCRRCFYAWQEDVLASPEAAAAALESVERELAALLKRVAPAEARRDDSGLF